MPVRGHRPSQLLGRFSNVLGTIAGRWLTYAALTADS
jgi:hypothetical protein